MWDLHSLLDERLVLFRQIGGSMGKELEVTLKANVRVHFDDNESEEGTVRYLLEKNLKMLDGIVM